MRFTVALTGIMAIEIKSRIRTKHMVRARAIYAYLMRLHGFSYPEIGVFLHRDHTTIINLIHHYERHQYSKEIGEKIKEAFPELSTESTAPVIISS